MTDCLIDFVGLRFCSAPLPASGLYINDLPGIETEMIASVSSKDEETFLETWAKIQKRASETFRTELINTLAALQGVNFNQVLFQTPNVSLVKPLTISTHTEEAPINTELVYLQAGKSRFVCVFIEAVEVYAATAGSIESVRIYDYETDTDLYLLPEPVLIAKGLNRIPIEKYFDLERSDIQLGVSITPAVGTSLYHIEQSSYQWLDRMLTPCYHCVNSYGLDIYGLDIIGNISNRAYFGVKAEIQCNIMAYVCQNKRMFASAWQYLLGSELMREKVSTPRLSFWTKSNIEDTKENRDGFFKDFQTRLKNAVKTIPQFSDSLCFNCEEEGGIYYASNV